jgi:hypothetical protein
MIKIPLSAAASALLRALVTRAGVPRDRILLTDAQSVDWRSLTLEGERHQIRLRIPGPDSSVIVQRMCSGLEDAEFSLSGVIVADIAVLGEARTELDGSISLTIEALTIGDD